MKTYRDFNIFQRILEGLLQYLEKKLYKRNWTYKEQVRYASRNIFEDNQWLSHDKLAFAICERHSNMLKETWYETPHDSQDSFRNKVGLNPHWKNSP